MTALIDYGAGNLFSLRCSLESLGETVCVTGDPQTIRRADRVILPGVGAFGDAAALLRQSGLDETIREIAGEGKPLMGICLGMQMLFQESHEYGTHPGLGLLRGTVRPIREILKETGADPEQALKIPHMGWNALRIRKESPLFRETRQGEYMYFVHSFAVTDCEDSLLADTEYGAFLTACVGRGNVFGCQFHPEKSGEAGLKLLKAFCETEALA